MNRAPIQPAQSGNPWLRVLAAAAMTCALILPAFAVPGAMANRQTRVVEGMQAEFERVEQTADPLTRHHARQAAARTIDRERIESRNSLL